MAVDPPDHCRRCNGRAREQPDAPITRPVVEDARRHGCFEADKSRPAPDPRLQLVEAGLPVATSSARRTRAVYLVVVAAGALWRSLRKLWVQLTAAILFVVLAHIAQGTDAIRRLSRPQWLVTVPIILLFGVVLVLTGSGLLKPSKRGEPTQPDKVGFGGAVLPASIVCIVAGFVIAAGQVLDRKGLALLGYLLSVVGVCSLLLDINSYLTTNHEHSKSGTDGHPPS